MAMAALVAASAVVLMDSAVYAQPLPTPPIPPAVTPPPATPTATPSSPCDSYVGLTNKIASCIRESIVNAADVYFDPDTGFYSLIARAITALMTFGVVVYGILAAAGMIERVGRDSLMLVIKIAMIGFFTTHCDLMYDEVLKLMDGASATVVGFTPGSGNAVDAHDPSGNKTGFGQIKCLQNMLEAQANAPAGQPAVGPWMGMDCIIDSVIGIKIATKVGAPSVAGGQQWINDNLADANSGPARGMLYLFFSSMQTSILGLLFAIIGFIFIYGMIHLIIKALFIYITGYLGITLMMIIAPIFIPLAIFKQTKEYFDKWVKLVINFVLQPIIILVFVSFSIAAVDLATYSGSYSIMYRLAGDASQKKGFSLNKYLEDNQVIRRQPTRLVQVVGAQSLNPQPLQTVAAGVVRQMAVGPDCNDPAKLAADPALKAQCDNMRSVSWWHNSMDWEKLASIRTPTVEPAAGSTPAQQIAMEVLSAVLFCGIVVFVMNGLLKIVPTLISDLLGDFGQSPNLAGAAGGLPKLGQSMGGIAQSLGSPIRSILGR